MYTINSLLQEWWEEVTLFIWSSPTKLISEDESLQKLIKKAMDTGVHVTACKACADQAGVTEILEQMGIEAIYWGKPLTKILKDDEKLLTI